jgi:tetratricopeptide (TPR) repeat protein
MTSRSQRTRYLWILCFVAGLVFKIYGQAGIDTQLVHRWVDTAWDIRFDQPNKTFVLAGKILEESTPDFYFGMVNGLQLQGEGYYIVGKLDSAITWYTKALDVAKAEKDNFEIGNSSTSLATIYKDQGKSDSSLVYFQQAIILFSEAGDSSSLSDALLRYGHVHNDMGHHERAIEAYLHSIRICEALGREDYIAYNYGAIGIVHDKQRNYVQAEEYFLQALKLFNKLDDQYGMMSIQNNLGILYKNQKDYSKSLEAYNHSLAIADSISFDRGQLTAHTNLGILNVEMGQFESALKHCTTGANLALELGAREALADNLNWQARAQVGLHDYNAALLNAMKALDLGKEVPSMERQRDAHLTLTEIYSGQHNYMQSLTHYKEFGAIKDSLYNIDKSKQISELLTLYETEKKDKEIELFAKNAEIDSIRKTRLWIALGLSFLIGGLLIYSQWIRHTRDRKIMHQENELEVQRRQAAEMETHRMTRELDFKKQELAAKALQLARKNEFLLSVHDQVDHIRTNPEVSVSDSARQITRQIMRDVESEEDWDQFLSSFREVHRDFMEQLQHIYPEISKSEMRLACLMKMNLSGKEIASMLNISPDGIKKARYRLRKKLDLDSEVDIQEFLLAFPG